MVKHSYKFVEDYDGLVGFGLGREIDEFTLTYYLQKFADDQHMALIRSKMTEADMEELFNLLSRLLKQYLTEREYHEVFLKEETSPPEA